MSAYDKELVSLYEGTTNKTKIKTKTKTKNSTYINGKCINCGKLQRLFNSEWFGLCCASCIQSLCNKKNR